MGRIHSYYNTLSANISRLDKIVGLNISNLYRLSIDNYRTIITDYGVRSDEVFSVILGPTVIRLSDGSS